MKPVIVKNLYKKYGDTQALNGVEFEVDKGEIFGLIGPDGSGKTTLFRILTTLLIPDQGEAFVDGHNVVSDYKKIRKKVGYMPGRFSLYQDLSVEENLRVFATIFNTSIEENYHLIKDIYQQIEPFKSRRAGALSGGMKQKLALCCALIHKPTVLFLDEPTTGVDPVSRKELWTMLKRLKDQGITIVVSTPYMDEASICDRIALIQFGEFMKIDQPDQITNEFKNILWSVRGKHMSRLLLDLRKHQLVKAAYAFGDAHHVTIDKNSKYFESEESAKGKIESFLNANGHSEISIHPIEATIEDCFMDLSEL